MSKSKKIFSIVFTFVIFLLISMQSSVNATIEEIPSFEGLEHLEVQVDLINTKKPENIDDNILNRVETYASGNSETLETYVINSLLNGVTTIDVSNYNVPTQDMLNFFSYVLFEHPETYVINSWEVYYRSGVALYVVPSYFINQEDVKFYYQKAEFMAQNFINSVPKDSSEIEKAVYVHNYICENTEYDFVGYDNNSMAPIVHSMYGLFINGLTVCDGYAGAFNYLAEKLGLDSEIITSKPMNHAWNLVKIGNSYYHVDATWDDTPIAGKDIYGVWNYEYFLLSDSGMYAKNHHSWETSIRATDTRYDNYFLRDLSRPIIPFNGKWYYIDRNDLDQIVFGMMDDLGADPKEVTFSDDKSTAKDLPVLITTGKELYYTDGKNIYEVSIENLGVISQVKVDTTSNELVGIRYYNGRFQVEYSNSYSKENRDIKGQLAIRTSSVNQQDFNLKPIKRGETYNLKAVNAEGNVTWSSSDTNVVTISNGVLKAVGEGNANITLTDKDTSRTIPVYVRDYLIVNLSYKNNFGSVYINGKYRGNGSFSYPKGAGIEISVTPNSNVRFVNMVINGTTYTSTSLRANSITVDTNITVNLERIYARANIENVIFNAKYYADSYADLKAAFGYNEAALRSHWLNSGIREGRRASIVFDTKYYLNNNDDLKKAFGNDLQGAYNHFVDCGWREERPSSDAYYGAYYRQNNKDLANLDSYELMVHFINNGINEGRKGTNIIDKTPINITEYLFNSKFYADTNQDLKAAFGYNEAALKNHWLSCGIAEGRQASTIFNSKEYLSYYSDLKAAFGNNYKAAYEHFINSGINEGRKGSRLYDVRYYLSNNRDLANTYGNNYSKVTEHFALIGINEGRDASSTFKISVYKSANNDLKNAFGNDNLSYYIHYMNFGVKENRKAY